MIRRSDMAAISPTLHVFDCDGVLVDSEVLATRIESQRAKMSVLHTGCAKVQAGPA